MTTNSWMMLADMHANECGMNAGCVENTDILLKESRTDRASQICRHGNEFRHTNMCVCDCWTCKGITSFHCHMYLWRRGQARKKKRHSIPANIFFFFLCVLVNGCLYNHGHLPEMTCQEVINAEQIVHIWPVCRPTALSSFHRSCSQIRVGIVQWCSRLSFDLPGRNEKQCNRIVEVDESVQRLTCAAAANTSNSRARKYVFSETRKLVGKTKTKTKY